MVRRQRIEQRPHLTVDARPQPNGNRPPAAQIVVDPTFVPAVETTRRISSGESSASPLSTCSSVPPKTAIREIDLGLEAAGPVVGERLLDFRLRVHDEGASKRDRLAQRLAGEKQKRPAVPRAVMVSSDDPGSSDRVNQPSWLASKWPPAGPISTAPSRT